VELTYRELVVPNLGVALRYSEALVVAFGIVSSGGTFAADLVVPTAIQPAARGPTWSVVGPLAPTYTDNALGFNAAGMRSSGTIFG
jgi:hypothetical protein